MSFLRRHHSADEAAAQAQEAALETPAGLHQRLSALVVLINASAGRLPVDSVVSALAVTDTLSEVIDAAGGDGLDVHALLSLQGILDDYLPTTLRAYLSLEPSVTDVPRPSGLTPKASLLEQIDALWLAASDLLTATRAQDADALLSQGNFLRTKFTRSDLDL